MNDFPYHETLRLKQFTAFQAVHFEFVSGVNVFVGENGTGKTHVMKALYAMQLTQARERGMDVTLEELFQTNNLADIVRRSAVRDAEVVNDADVTVSGSYNNREWSYSVNVDLKVAHGITTKVTTLTGRLPKPERPVFIPAIDMMGHTKGFTEAYEEVRLDFDLTCRDVVNLLRLERKNGEATIFPGAGLDEPLARLLGGEIERDEQGRFYLVNALGRLPMPMVAEGLRKIATLVQLERNGWLSPGTTLFWDEPEVNLNPILMGEVVGAILSLTRRGVQVFLATHSYVILKELDLQAQKGDAVRYFAFQPGGEGTKVNATDDFALLSPNPILAQYDSLYDRELTRSTGRNRQGERVR